MSAGTWNTLFPQSGPSALVTPSGQPSMPAFGGGLGMALANPQNISALQNWPQQASPFTPQQSSTIDQLSNIFGQFVNPNSLAGAQPITNPLNQAIQAMGLVPQQR